MKFYKSDFLYKTALFHPKWTRFLGGKQVFLPLISLPRIQCPLNFFRKIEKRWCLTAGKKTKEEGEYEQSSVTSTKQEWCRGRADFNWPCLINSIPTSYNLSKVRVIWFTSEPVGSSPRPAEQFSFMLLLLSTLCGVVNLCKSKHDLRCPHFVGLLMRWLWN